MFDDKNRMTFARNLNYYLTISGMTQKEMAEIVGVSAPTFNDWMHGRKYPRINKIERLAQYFGIQKSDLIEAQFEDEKQQCENENTAYKNKIILARNLAYYLELSGKTQTEVADDLGIAFSTFNGWMCAKKYPRITKIEMLADYFGIQKSELIDEKSDCEKKVNREHNPISDKNRKIFARNLAYHLEKSGKTQKEVAEIIGVSTSIFNCWMLAQRYPRIDKIEKLADYFGIQKTELIEDDPIKLYENIKNLHAGVGLSQREHDDKIGYVNRSMHSKIEKDECDLPTAKAGQIVDIFKITLNELIGSNLSEKKRHIINVVVSAPEEKLPLILRLINSALEDE